MPQRGLKLEAPPDFMGPEDQLRKCTDVLMMLVLLCCWGFMTYLGMDALQRGEPAVFVAQMDYKGRTCGYDAGVHDKPLLYYVGTDGTGVCVDHCPEETDTSQFICTEEDGGENSPNECNMQYKSTPMMGQCVFEEDSAMKEYYYGYKAKASTGWIRVISSLWNAKYYILGYGIICSVLMGAAFLELMRLDNLVGCMIWASALVVFVILCTCAFYLWPEGATFESFLPEDVKLSDQNGPCYSIQDEETCLKSRDDRYYYPEFKDQACGWCCGDYCTSTNFNRCEPVGWVIRQSNYVGHIKTGLGFNDCPIAPSVEDANDAYWMQVSSLTVSVFAVIWLCVMCAMRKQLMLAGSVITESSRPLLQMPLMFTWPIMQIVGTLTFLVVWALYVVYTFSIGHFEQQTNNVGISTQQFVYDDVHWRGYYLLFCLIWTIGWAVGIGQIVSALAVSQWYFTKDKLSCHSGVVVRAIFLTFWNHSGTAALGAVLLTLFIPFTFILGLIRRMINSDNPCARAMCSCCQCCVWFLDHFIFFINQGAYIQTAMFGYGFAAAGTKSYQLLLRNAGRVAGIDIASQFVLRTMQLIIVSICATLAYFTLRLFVYEGGDAVPVMVLPTCMVVVLAWYVSLKFQQIFGMAMLTITQCFLVDSEMYDPDQMFAEPALKDFVERVGGEKTALLTARVN